MPGLGRLILLACLAQAASVSTARAFLEKPGEGKVILLATFDTADRYWTREGRLQPVAAYRKFSLSGLAEYGLDASTTLIARNSGGRMIDSSGASMQGDGGVGARRLLLDAGAMRIAAHVMVSAGTGLEGMPDRRSGAALDLRLAAATTFSVLGKPAFFEMSAGPRIVTGDWRGARVDLTFGVRPAAKWLVLVQAFNRFNEAGPSDGRVRAHKAQATVIYDMHERWSVMAGAFATIAARAERRQVGAMTGLVRRF